MEIRVVFMFVMLSGLSFILISKPLFADNKENREYLDEVVREFQEECRGRDGFDYLNCWSEHSPKKCKSLVYGQDHMAWSRCVYSCGSAGFYSKTFGECSN